MFFYEIHARSFRAQISAFSSFISHLDFVVHNSPSSLSELGACVMDTISLPLDYFHFLFYGHYSSIGHFYIRRTIFTDLLSRYRRSRSLRKLSDL